MPAASQTNRGELALSLQEAFTVAVRVRAGRQVAADAGSFRSHIKQLLATADQRARAIGYDGETVKRAVYAYIALLDESVLASTQPMFANWSSQPLQEEVFGDNKAGHLFFRAVEELLQRQDSDSLADLLEVHQLCMLLGFRGPYEAGDIVKLHPVTSAIEAKIMRIRGGTPGDLVPDWQLPADEAIVVGRDPWARRLAIFAIAAFGVAVVLWALYAFLLGSKVNDLTELIGK